MITSLWHTAKFISHKVHVYGHQDDNNKALITEAYMNVLADFIARKNACKPYQTHPPQEIAVYVDNQYVSYSYADHLRKVVSFQDAKTYLRNIYKWDQQTYHYIDWEAHENAYKNPHITKSKSIKVHTKETTHLRTKRLHRPHHSLL